MEQCSLTSDKVFGLCDANRDVRRSFGAEGTGIYFLIDAEGRIAATGKLYDVEGIGQALDKVVSDHDVMMWEKEFGLDDYETYE